MDQLHLHVWELFSVDIQSYERKSTRRNTNTHKKERKKESLYTCKFSLMKKIKEMMEQPQ